MQLAMLVFYLNLLTKISSFDLFPLSHAYHSKCRLTYLLDLYSSLKTVRQACKETKQASSKKESLKGSSYAGLHLSKVSSWKSPVQKWLLPGPDPVRWMSPGKARVSHEAHTWLAQCHDHPATASMLPPGWGQLFYSATQVSDSPMFI